MIFNNSFKNQSGTTVIEALTAVFVFSLLATIAAGIFFRAVDIQRRAFAAQKIQENTLFIMEALARDARVSDICPNPGICTATVLEMQHPVRGLLRFSLDTARGVIVKNETSVNVDMTATEVNYTRFDFVTAGAGSSSDCRQPKITIVASARNRVGKPFIIDFQTTVTSRDARQELLFPVTPPCP